MSRSPPDGDLRHFVAAARSAVSEANWYAAIALALTLPDICGSIDREGRVGERYAKWWDERAAGGFWIKPDAGEEWDAHSLVTGNDAYYLRCAYLHEGKGDPGVKAAKDRFRFMVSPNGSYGQSRDEREVTLNVGYLVEVVCQAVEGWLADCANDPAVLASLRDMVSIIPSAITVIDYAKHENHERCRSAKAAGRMDLLTEIETLVARLGDELNGRSSEADLKALAMWWELKAWVKERKPQAVRELQQARASVGRLP